MKKIAIYGLAILSVLQFTACSDDDDKLTPSGVNDDLFSVPADADDPESVLRREFHETTGIHLLFSEVLKSTVVGQDSDGNDIVKEETIDFRWSLTDYKSSLEYNFEMLEKDDMDGKRKAAEMFIKEVFPHIDGSTLSPYSVMMVKSLEWRSSSYDDWSGYTLPGWRCLGVDATGWIDSQDEDEIKDWTFAVCKSLVSAQFDAYSDEAEPWIDLSYDCGASDYVVDWVDDWDRDITKVYELGFMSYRANRYGRLEYDYLPYSSDDFEAFFEAVFERSQEDFEAEFGQYAKIMEKYNLMKSLILQTGYKF